MNLIEKETKFKKGILICIKILIIFFIGLALLNILIFKDNLIQNFNDVGIFVFFVIYLFIIGIAIYLHEKIKKIINKKIQTILKYVLWLFFIGIQVFYAISIMRQIGFDCGVVFGDAIQLMNGTFDNVLYYSTYSNNIFLLLLLEMLFHIIHFFNIENYLMASVILNVICIDIAIIYIHKVCKAMFEKKYSFLHYFFSIPMLGLTPYIAVTYTDTLSLMFPIAIFYYYICYKRNTNKKQYIAFITIFSIIGFLMKPTNVIVLIAICIVEAIDWINHKCTPKFTKEMLKKRVKSCALNFIVIFVAFSITYGGYSIYKNIKLGDYISKEDFANNGFPLTHFFMMGLKPTDLEDEEDTYYGYYNENDVENTRAHIGTREKITYNLQEAFRRLEKMGIGGYIRYLYDKYTWIISDGTFAYGIEGNFYTDEPIENGPVAQIIQQFSYRGEKGYTYVTTNILQAYWVIVLFFIVMSTAIRFLRKEMRGITILRLSVIGIILFILLFEARARYLINYVPIFIVLSVYGIMLTHKKLQKVKCKIETGRRKK